MGKTITRQLCKLALFKASAIPEGFRCITQTMPDVEEYVQLEEYYREQWMKKTTPEVFSCYNEMNKTTSALEGWHHRIGVRFGRHPKLFLFLINLKKEAKYQDFRIKRNLAGGKKQLKKRRTHIYQETNIIQNYVNRNVCIEEALKTLSGNDNFSFKDYDSSEPDTENFDIDINASSDQDIDDHPDKSDSSDQDIDDHSDKSDSSDQDVDDYPDKSGSSDYNIF